MQQQNTSVLGKKFSQSLRTARGARSQAEFARFLGIKHQQTYQAYEAGRVPDGETLYQIASKLDVSIQELVTGQRSLSEETQFTIIIHLMTDAMTWIQLLQLTKAIMEHSKLTAENQAFWCRLLIEWILAKMPANEQAGSRESLQKLRLALPDQKRKAQLAEAPT